MFSHFFSSVQLTGAGPAGTNESTPACDGVTACLLMMPLTSHNHHHSSTGAWSLGRENIMDLKDLGR